MTDKEAMAMALDALETEVSIDWTNNDEFNTSAEKMHEAITALKARLAQPEQEPVAHLWECLGRWSAYLVNNGTQAECAPPSWLVEAVKNATTPPQRTEPLIGCVNHDCDKCKPLTHEQRQELMSKAWNKWLSNKDDGRLFAWDFSFEVEAAHGIKENKHD
jgi:hypothetical protein